MGVEAVVVAVAVAISVAVAVAVVLAVAVVIAQIRMGTGVRKVGEGVAVGVALREGI